MHAEAALFMPNRRFPGLDVEGCRMNTWSTWSARLHIAGEAERKLRTTVHEQSKFALVQLSGKACQTKLVAGH